MTVLVCCGAYTSSYAIPRFALSKGEANCLSCHTNPTGGGIRTSGGEAFSKNVLAMWKRGGEFSGQISEGIRIGADIRTQFLSFSTTGPVGMPAEETRSMSTFHAMSSALMVDASLTNTLNAYVRWDPLANSNEVFGTLHLVHESGELWEAGSVVTHAYVKTGAFVPAFGIRFDDHTVYTRGGNRGVSGNDAAGLFWVEGYRDVGVELGATLFDHIGLQIAYLNGNEEFPNGDLAFLNDNKALSVRATGSAELIDDALSFEIGGSIYMHSEVVPGDTSAGIAARDLSLIGVHIGIRGGPVTLLAEYDIGENSYRTDGNYVDEANALTAEIAVRATQGLDIIGRFETYKDRTADLDGNIVDSRITIGAQWFPLRFLEIRPEFRIAKASTPGAERLKFDQTTYLIQTHLYF